MDRSCGECPEERECLLEAVTVERDWLREEVARLLEERRRVTEVLVSFIFPDKEAARDAG
ncbi:MAG: hypothetical protein C4551_02390 [Bacillota bacterium]|nr:MAG: hypothetical protein C4551_02390 [Bacillota bacterium]